MDKACCRVCGFWYRTWRPATPDNPATKLAKIILSAFSRWMRCATGSLSWHITFCASVLHRSANYWGPSFLACLAVCSLIKWYWFVCTSRNLCLNTSLNFIHVVPSAWSSRQVLWNDFAWSASFRAAISRQSLWSQFPFLAALSTVSKNSSKGTADSYPDHFGIKEIRDKSLWTVGKPIDVPSLNLFLPSIVPVLPVA